MDQALKVLKNKKVALFIIAYEAEDNIEQVLKRIPKNIVNKFSQIYLIDDSSKSLVRSSLRSASPIGTNLAGISSDPISSNKFFIIKNYGS